MHRSVLGCCLCFSGISAVSAGWQQSQHTKQAVDRARELWSNSAELFEIRTAGPERLTPEEKPRISELEAAFGGEKDFWDAKASLCGKCVSKADQQSIMSVNKEAEWSSGVYGEIVPQAFLQLLRMLHVRPGQRFYDLGSGAGKTVAMAAHVFGLRAAGIELSGDRHAAGCAALEALQRGWASGESRAEAGAEAELVHGSFFDYDISDADVVFTDSVMFSNDMMQRIAAIGRSLKQGARIVSARGLPGDDYRKVDSVSIQGTWGELGLSIFEKVGESRPVQSVLPLSAAKERCTASKA